MKAYLRIHSLSQVNCTTRPKSAIIVWLILASMLSMESHAFIRKKIDFVVGVDGDFKAAMTAAAKSASASNQFIIFFPDGEYNIGVLTGDGNQKTTIGTSYVSFIGQSMDKTIIYNKSTSEGISITATLHFNNANSLYLQDLTVMNKANYGNTASYSQTGRFVAIQEQGNKIIYKNVKLLSTQDTYYTKGTRTYWENGTIHGTTDFICGGGDVYFNGCNLFALKKSALIAPATNTSWGYVFKECTIDGDVSDYTLGRSWSSAKAVFINTTMKKLPTASGWGDPMNSVPVVFAEYQSKTATGAAIDLSKRRTTYTSGSTTVQLNPILSSSQASQYTVANVLGGSDNWQPQQIATQATKPNPKLSGNVIQWSDDTAVLFWAIFRNGKFQTSITSPSFGTQSLSPGDTVTIRAANAMGGLGQSSEPLIIPTTILSSSSTIATSSSSSKTSSSSIKLSSSVFGSSSSLTPSSSSTTMSSCSITYSSSSLSPPTVRILTPEEGSVLTSPATIVVEVQATYTDGSIANVQLLLNGKLVRQENGAPFQWNDQSQDTPLQDLQAGTYTLVAIATDNHGVQGQTSLQFVVTAPTQIQIVTKEFRQKHNFRLFDLIGRHQAP